MAIQGKTVDLYSLRVQSEKP